jgi:hypothetical protein
MPKAQILVRVRNISKDENGHPTELHGTESVITYKAFQYTKDQFQLVSEVEEAGKHKDTGEQLYKDIEGNPNLHAEYRTTPSQRNADLADNLGVSKKGPGRPARTEKTLTEVTG